MKKYFCATLVAFAVSAVAHAQDNISPTPKHSGITAIQNGTVHTGTGAVISNATIIIRDDKIADIGTGITIPAGAKLIDATGMQVYPGLILSNTNIGLREIDNQVRGTNDYQEIGDLNPNVQSIVAYNTDSKITNTLRSNGILLAQVSPRGALLAGTSSVVQFDAWNYEDAAYKRNNGMHLYMPSLLVRPNRGGEIQGDPLKAARDRIETVRQFFRAAKAYHADSKPETENLKLAAASGLFDKSQRLFIHCNIVKEMLTAVSFAKEFGFDVTIIGGAESWQIAPLLQQNNISVILQQQHALPVSVDDDIDQPFKTPAVLQKAGVLFAITDQHDESTGRNLPFNAGTAAAYGLSKEEALMAITLNAAKILHIDDRTGSLEKGKDANIIISKGDILDMRSSIVTNALIQGREINLDDKHKQLNRKFSAKYGISN